MGEAPAPDLISSSTNLKEEPAPTLGSPPPIDEAKTPKPDTTPKAAPRHLEVPSTSEHGPLALPVFSPLPPPNGPPDPVEMRPTSQQSSQTPSGSRQSQPSPPSSSSRPLGTSKKRNRDTLEGPELAELDPSVACSTSIPSSKRAKPISTIAEEEEDTIPFQRTGLGGEPIRGGFTTPPPSTKPPVLVSRPDYPFNRGSPSPQQRPLPRTPPVGNLGSLRHRVPSPARRPGTDPSGAQLTVPLVGDTIPGAPVQGVAVPVRGDDARLTLEPASGKVWPDHTVAPSTLASAVGGIFNPPSSSTPARPGSSSLLMRTAARTARASRPYDRPTFIDPPPPPLPAISTSRLPAEGDGSGGSQSSNSSNSSGAEGANQGPPPAPLGEPATPSNTISRLRRGMPHSQSVQSSGALDPLRFTGAHQAVGSRAHRTPTPPETPDRIVRQGAPETPMASSTRYGTEINPSMLHLY